MAFSSKMDLRELRSLRRADHRFPIPFVRIPGEIMALLLPIQ
jgi:hypothetical protein